MKITRLFLLAINCLLLACHSTGSHTAPEKQEEKKNFFPVADYIKSEISYVDSTPFGIMKYTIRNGRTDSAFIKTAEFDQLAREFLPAELLDESLFAKDFTETSFFDQTTQLLTFTYSTKNRASRLQRVDVLARPSAGFNKVSSIYMEKLMDRKDTAVVRKMYWRARKSFEIISIYTPVDHASVADRLKVVWDTE